MIALGWAGQRSVRPRAGWLVAVGWSIQRQSPPPTGHRPPATGHPRSWMICAARATQIIQDPAGLACVSGL